MTNDIFFNPQSNQSAYQPLPFLGILSNISRKIHGFVDIDLLGRLELFLG
jgi:hypothetical protein